MMIHSDSIIHWMDTQKGIVREEGINKFYQYNINRIKMTDDPNISVESFDGNIKITDWKGWSDVIQIERHKNQTNWLTILTSMGNTITATYNQIIPIYNPEKMKIGFHGETQYEHEFIKMLDIKLGDILRVRHCIDEDDNDINFDKVSAIMIPPFIEADGYNIITKHGYCNCNDIYISANTLNL